MIEAEDVEVMVQVGYDPFMRNVSISVHSDAPMTASQFLDELAQVVAEYSEDPEKLFDDSTMIEAQ